MIDRAKIDYFTEEGSVDAVTARTADTTDPRLAEVMSSLVKHLHAFTKDVELTHHLGDLGNHLHRRRTGLN